MMPSPLRVFGSIPYWDQEAAVASLQKNPDVFDYVSLFWYALQSDGSLTRYPYAQENLALIDYLHEEGITVLAVVTNLPADEEEGSWDWMRVDEAISTDDARARHVAALVQLTEDKGFDGINIDYEQLEKDQRESFTLFITELAQALHAKNKILGVALLPKPEENNPDFSNGSEAQDWAALGEAADQLYLMTYDEHWDTSKPGAIASLPWLESIVRYAKNYIPLDKLFAGVPLYGYDWSEGEEAQGLTYAHVTQLIRRYSPAMQWHEELGSNSFTYVKGGEQHEVWFEDARSIRAKLGVLSILGVRGLAFWRLGGEDEKVWNYVAKEKSPGK
jgi:spore germination protein YaaH